MENQRLAPRKAAAWTRIDDYVVAMARLRQARRRGAQRIRTQPEMPHWSLSTLPFLMLTVALAVVAVAIAVDAWPGRERARPSAVAGAAGPAPRRCFVGPMGVLLWGAARRYGARRGARRL